MKLLINLLIALSFCFAQSLNQDEKEIQKFVENKTSEAIDLLEKIVNINSGSLNIKGNLKVGKILQFCSSSSIYDPKNIRHLNIIIICDSHCVGGMFPF